MCQMMIYASDPPYASLICEFLNVVLPQSLEKLKYEPSQAGYMISGSTITRIGIPITPIQKARASSSQVPPSDIVPEEPHPTQEDAPHDLTPDSSS